MDDETSRKDGRILEDRFTSEEIYERILIDADEEISRSLKELFFSALAAGFAITITVLLYGTMKAASTNILIESILYPLGFIYIIVGNYQLYTENTLPPVALILERIASVPAMLIMWGTILVGNFSGAVIGAFLLVKANVLSPDALDALQSLTASGIATDPMTLFAKGAFAGLIVAGLVWLDFSSQNTTARVLIIYIAFISIPVGGLFHIVVSMTEVMILAFSGGISIISALTFLFPILLGNTIGGVALVTIVNYFQTPRYIGVESGRLSVSEWLFSVDSGRNTEAIEKDRN